jgi:hypothetical protein
MLGRIWSRWAFSVTAASWRRRLPPYLALLALRLRQPGRRALWIGLLALTVGLLLLRGHPQIAFYGLLMLGILGLVEIIGAWRRHVPRAEIGRFAGGLAGGVVLGGALAAALLLPVREYAPESIHGSSEARHAYHYATNWSLSRSEIATPSCRRRWIRQGPCRHDAVHELELSRPGFACCPGSRRSCCAGAW